MEYVRQTMRSADLSGLIELPPTLRDTKVEIIVLPVENEVPKKPKKKINFDFLKDKVPPLPESFFDPLPEEELQAWGL
jgi:hypothetical protein